jgi:hypothetical protein
VRRKINQQFFKQVFVEDYGELSSILAEPFDVLLHPRVRELVTAPPPARASLIAAGAQEPDWLAWEATFNQKGAHHAMGAQTKRPRRSHVGLNRETLVGLSGGLSNIDLEPLLIETRSLHSPIVRSRSQDSRAGWSDGRRKFGEVSGAIKAVMAKNGAMMRMKEIHAEVEQLLGGDVSFQSVADCLLKNSKGAKPLFERPRYGHYRLSGLRADAGK